MNRKQRRFEESKRRKTRVETEMISKDGTSSFELIEATNGPFFRSSKNNQWKRILNKDQIKKIENKFSKTMLAFGYELSKE